MSTINNLPSIGNKNPQIENDPSRSGIFRSLMQKTATLVFLTLGTVGGCKTEAQAPQSNQPASVELGFNVQNELHPLIHGRFTPDQLDYLPVNRLS